MTARAWTYRWANIKAEALKEDDYTRRRLVVSASECPSPLSGPHPSPDFGDMVRTRAEDANLRDIRNRVWTPRIKERQKPAPPPPESEDSLQRCLAERREQREQWRLLERERRAERKRRAERRKAELSAEWDRRLYAERRQVTLDPSRHLCTLCETHGYRCKLNSGQFTTLCETCRREAERD